MHDDLTYLVERVRTETTGFPRNTSQVCAADITPESLLPSDWALALVSLASWIGYALGVSDEVRLRALVGGYYYYQYILALDQLLDRPDGRRSSGGCRAADGARLVPKVRRGLAGDLSLLQLRAIREYQQLFPPASSFWDHLNRYHMLWAAALTWEREGAAYGALPLRDAMERESRKCAGLYVSCAAIALGGGREDLLPSLEQAAMVTNMIMNLIDDCEDWWDDLAAGRHNSFVALAVCHGLVPAGSPSQDSVLAAVLSGRLHELYADAVAKLSKEARQIVAPIGVKHWVRFLENIEDAARRYPTAFQATVADVTQRVFAGRTGTAKSMSIALRAKPRTEH
jgi:hypothetical protein